MQKKKSGENSTFIPILNYGGKQSENSIGVRLLQKAEKNIVIKSHLYKIEGMTADDIAQELRIKIWNVRNKYKSKKSSMSTFVNFVVSNHLKNLYKESQGTKQYLNKSIQYENMSKKDMLYVEENIKIEKELDAMNRALESKKRKK